jgi:hypothetical protein
MHAGGEMNESCGAASLYPPVLPFLLRVVVVVVDALEYWMLLLLPLLVCVLRLGGIVLVRRGKVRGWSSERATSPAGDMSACAGMSPKHKAHTNPPLQRPMRTRDRESVITPQQHVDHQL